MAIIIGGVSTLIVETMFACIISLTCRYYKTSRAPKLEGVLEQAAKIKTHHPSGVDDKPRLD